jgi:hypothetical protein
MPKGKSTGPRQQRPVFAIVTYSDENGAVQLDKNNLHIKIERDSAKIVELLTSGDGDMGNAAVVRVELPQPTPRKASDGAGAAA